MNLDLRGLCGNSEKLLQLKNTMRTRGCEILSPTNPYEVLRWRSRRGVGVVYRTNAGHMCFNSPSAMADLAQVVEQTKGPMAPVKVSRTKLDKKARAGELAAIIERDGTDCFFCGLGLPPLGTKCRPQDEMTIEHLIPQAHGGPQHLSNKFAAHFDCNQLAGNLSGPEKIRLRDRMRLEALTDKPPSEPPA